MRLLRSAIEGTVCSLASETENKIDEWTNYSLKIDNEIDLPAIFSLA